jgi:hypothetical protein
MSKSGRMPRQPGAEPRVDQRAGHFAREGAPTDYAAIILDAVNGAP